jgi:hypothetical protein
MTLNIAVLTPIPRTRALESFLKSIYTTEWRSIKRGALFTVYLSTVLPHNCPPARPASRLVPATRDVRLASPDTNHCCRFGGLGCIGDIPPGP